MGGINKQRYRENIGKVKRLNVRNITKLRADYGIVNVQLCSLLPSPERKMSINNFPGTH